MRSFRQYKFVIFWAYVLVQTTGGMEVRWCTISEKEQSKCTDMKSAFEDDKFQTEATRLTCVQAMSRYACMRMIASDGADIIKLDDTDFYAAGRLYHLKPILKEGASSDLNAPAFLHRAVVVVRKDGPIKKIADLKGKRSCHTAVREFAGWDTPVGNLIAMGVMKVRDCSNTVSTVAEFFSKSCAPGAFDRINNPNGDNKLTICALCENSQLCSKNDHYAGYLGSFSCLYDDRGDVSFQKHSTIEEFIAAKQGTGLTVNKEQYRLLCPDDTLKNVDEWEACYWAQRSSDVVVTSPSKSEEYLSSLKNFLQMAALNYGPTAKGFKIFDSAYYNSANLLFTDNTVKLSALGNDATYRSYFDKGFLHTMEHYMTCGERVKWCVIDDPELYKCKDISAAFMSARITLGMECVKGKNADDCMKMLRDGEADIMMNGGGYVYAGGRHYNLVPIIYENYDPESKEGMTYWAVAVARKNNPTVNINNLKGKTSCHTGIQKSTGWNIPVGFLMEKGLINVGDQCDTALAVGNFFSQSCIPGALSPKYNPNGNNPATMCALCGGVQSCHKDNTNKYYGYTGALRCLVEKNADVAFVNHLTVTDNTDGANTDRWAANLKSSDFELLCPDGSRKPVSDYKDCYLARNPSHTLVVGHHLPDMNRTLLWRIFNQGQQIFDESKSTKFRMFTSGDLGDNILFKDSTVKLEEISLKKRYYETWLGKSYMAVMKEIDLQECTSGTDRLLVNMTSYFLILAISYFALLCMCR